MARLMELRLILRCFQMYTSKVTFYKPRRHGTPMTERYNSEENNNLFMYELTDLHLLLYLFSLVIGKNANNAMS